MKEPWKCWGGAFPQGAASTGVPDGWELGQCEERQICFLHSPDKDTEA